MRAWENRGDTIVIDEPFYAHYLKVTGLDHPGRDEIIAHHDMDWRRVADSLLAPVPSNIRVFYQKQMSHHLLPHMGREWLDSVTHAFLIRDPSAMLASLGEKLSNAPSRCCVRCVRRSRCRSRSACCGGRPGGVNRTVSGPGTGTTGSSNRPASKRRHRQRPGSPR
jgi:hypothetical protein